MVGVRSSTWAVLFFALPVSLFVASLSLQRTVNTWQHFHFLADNSKYVAALWFPCRQQQIRGSTFISLQTTVNTWQHFHFLADTSKYVGCWDVCLDLWAMVDVRIILGQHWNRQKLCTTNGSGYWNGQKSMNLCKLSYTITTAQSESSGKAVRGRGWSLLKMRRKGEVVGIRASWVGWRTCWRTKNRWGVLDKKVEQMWKIDSTYESNSFSWKNLQFF